MAKGKGKIKKSILISILVPVLIILFIASAYFAIIQGMVKIIEGIVTKLADIKGGLDSFTKHPWTWISDGMAQISNFFSEKLNGTFNPSAAGIEGLFKPTIVMNTDDFENIKSSIDTAQVNRDSAGLEDYMLKIMLLSYYRSIYLSDYTVYIQITPEEKGKIEKLNDQANEDDGKFGCPFDVIQR